MKNFIKKNSSQFSIETSLLLQFLQKKRKMFFYKKSNEKNLFSGSVDLEQKKALEKYQKLHQLLSLSLYYKKKKKYYFKKFLKGQKKFFKISKNNLFFSSVQVLWNKKKSIREPQCHAQKFVRRFFSYQIELENNIRVHCGNTFRFHFIKINDIYQNSQYVLDLILFFLKKRIPYPRIRNILEFELKKVSFIKGVRLTYSGRLGGKTNKAERKKINTIRIGKPSLHIFSSKLDFVQGDAETKFGMAGVKVWIRYE